MARPPWTANASSRASSANRRTRVSSLAFLVSAAWILILAFRARTRRRAPPCSCSRSPWPRTPWGASRFTVPTPVGRSGRTTPRSWRSCSSSRSTRSDASVGGVQPARSVRTPSVWSRSDWASPRSTARPIRSPAPWPRARSSGRSPRSPANGEHRRSTGPRKWSRRPRGGARRDRAGWGRLPVGPDGLAALPARERVPVARALARAGRRLTRGLRVRDLRPAEGPRRERLTPRAEARQLDP